MCHGNHPPQFHAFARRRFHADESQTEKKVLSKVPRLICMKNKRRRIETGERLQYTMTILPGFLIPHSTVLVDAVHKALHSYLREEKITQQGAALKMGCLHPMSFRLFYKRVQQRIDGWIAAVVRLVLALEGEVRKDWAASGSSGLRQKWGRFEELGSEHLRLYSRIPGTTVMSQVQGWQYLYAQLNRSRPVLGP